MTLDEEIMRALGKLVETGILTEGGGTYRFPFVSLGSRDAGKAIRRLTNLHGELVGTEAIVLATVPPLCFFNGGAGFMEIDACVRLAITTSKPR